MKKPSHRKRKGSLTATLHKQWLDLNALFRTMGAEGNTYYRKPTWNVNLTLQQQLLKNHLTVSLGINNLAGSFCDSIAFYSKASSM